ncbi:MAG: glycosyltransferase [Oscillospiraceae bacterium]
MTRILIVVDSAVYGGVEKVLTDIANSLCTDYDITVVSTYYRDEFANLFDKRIKYKYIFKKFYFRIYGIMMKIPSNILRKLFVKGEYDIEIAFQEGIPFKLVSISHAHKIGWLHNNIDVYDGNMAYAKNREKLIKMFKSFSDIVCVSEYSKKKVMLKYPELEKSLIKIYNPIRRDEIEAKASRDVCFKKTKFTICVVGRITKEKGIFRIVNVCKKLLSEGENFELLIVGCGDDLPALLSMVEKEGLKENIKIKGFTINPYPYIKESDLCVSPSYNESFGISLAEAIVLKTPALSVRNGGADDVLKNGMYGMICDNTDEALYKALKEILNDKSVYSSLCEKVLLYQDDFSMKTCLDQIENLFN